MKENAYSEAWYSTFSDTIPDARTRAEVAFITEHLPRFEFPHLLDVCCGRGRHAIRLAATGYDVLGFDANAAAVAAARHQGSTATFLVHDLRNIRSLGGPFDGALCLWQSFGQFNADGNLEVLRSLGAIIRPGGRLVLDLYQREAARRLPAEEIADRDGARVRTIRTWTGPRLRVELVYLDGRGADTFEWHVYDVDEIRELAEASGWEVRTTCAWWDSSRTPTPDDVRVQYVLERPVTGTSV